MNADPISKLHKWTRDIMVGWLAGDTNDDNYGQPQSFEYFVCQTWCTPSPLLKGDVVWLYPLFHYFYVGNTFIHGPNGHNACIV